MQKVTNFNASKIVNIFIMDSHAITMLRMFEISDFSLVFHPLWAVELVVHGPLHLLLHTQQILFSLQLLFETFDNILKNSEKIAVFAVTQI